MDPFNGNIVSMVGGVNYNISNFNRVTQAYRQPGSSIKPFIYAQALETKKFLPECTVFLQPTSPIRDISKLDQSILDVFSGKFNTSMAATKTHHFIWEKNQNGEWEPPYGNMRPRRQDFHQVKETGSFFSFNTLKFLEKGDRIIKPVNLQITSEIESYEIDTLVDWEIMEALVKSKSSK